MNRKSGDDGQKDSGGSRLSALGVLAILVMLAMLGWAGWYALKAWNAMSGVKMSPLGWVFMTMGVIVTFLVGAGLMALIFYSSRHDMDR
jgi:TRAP-type C4-dicarboxylate transport system permease small subunit